jgi:hypothetical protein
MNTHTRDDTPPETIIDFGPSRTETSASATFIFSSTESGSSFQCRLDDRAFRTCVSPKSYSGLDNGSHTFEVRATDVANNEDPTPSSRTWVVNLGERRHSCKLPDTGGNTASSDVPTMPRRARVGARNRSPLRLTTTGPAIADKQRHGAHSRCEKSSLFTLDSDYHRQHTTNELANS